MPEFPCMVYKPGSMFLWDGELFDYLVLSDEEELAIALADGWSLGKPHPLDHDGDGVLGGSLKGEQSTATLGRKRKTDGL